jgi:hypothetical protein
MFLWPWLAACVTGLLLGRISGVIFHGLCDFVTMYKHTPPPNKRQWIVVTRVFFRTHICVCASRFDANVLFKSLKSPRMLVNAHQRFRDGFPRELLYGGALDGRMLVGMRKFVN